MAEAKIEIAEIADKQPSIVNPQPQLPPFDYKENILCQNSQWQKKENKSQGANSAGNLGGFYTVNDRTFFVKQDPIEDKNICEVFASQFMRFVAEEIGDNPNLIANVDYVNTENGVYIASEVFNNYRDLYLDAYYAHTIYPQLPSSAEHVTKIPEKRPGYLKSVSAIDNMMLTGRYNGLAEVLALRAIVDDPDVHFENLGVVPMKATQENNLIPLLIPTRKESVPKTSINLSSVISGSNAESTLELPMVIAVLSLKKPESIACSEIVIKGKTYYVYDIPRQNIEEFLENSSEVCVFHNDEYQIIPNVKNARAVGIDFGGALGDKRWFFGRKFDGVIHIDKIANAFRYLPSTEGPPAYMNQITDSIGKSTNYFETLARFGCLDAEKVKNKINSEIDRAVIFYSNKPSCLFNFAQRIGIDTTAWHAANNNPQLMGIYIKEYLHRNFLARQKHAKELFLQYLSSQDVKTQFILIKSYLDDKESKSDFFKKIEKENSYFFSRLTQCEQLALPQRPRTIDAKNVFSLTMQHENLKAIFVSKLWQAYHGKAWDKQSPEIIETISATDQLIKQYNETIKIVNAVGNIVEKQKAVERFIKIAATYEKSCIKITLGQKLVIAACALVGGLIGVALGAVAGLVVGTCIGGGAGSVIPFFGNLAGAISAGSIGGIVTALAGAGVGGAIGVSVGAFLLGSSTACVSGIASHYGMFSDCDKSLRKLANGMKEAVTEELCQEKKAAKNESTIGTVSTNFKKT